MRRPRAAEEDCGRSSSILSGSRYCFFNVRVGVECLCVGCVFFVEVERFKTIIFNVSYCVGILDVNN